MVQIDKNPSMHRWETLANRIVNMDRSALVRMLRGLRCNFKLDFSDDFLDTISMERLRHIVLAASLHDRGQG